MKYVETRLAIRRLLSILRQGDSWRGVHFHESFIEW